MPDVKEKGRRLRRYQNKDYDDLVDFPVEIVNRDGMVRRFSFEDSVRLYQRRILFASVRYPEDSDLVEAEVAHCQSRVQQIRRSFFYRHGWGTPEGQPAAVECFGDLAGEIAAFLLKVLPDKERPEVCFEKLGDEAADQPEDGRSCWFLTTPSSPGGLILYVFRFAHQASPRDDGSYGTFLESLRSQAQQPLAEQERLVAQHQTSDCGLVLSYWGIDAQSDTTQPRPSVSEPKREVDPWDQVVYLLRKRRFEEVLTHCQLLIDQHPWHLKAYLTGASVACMLGRFQLAQDFAFLGHGYFPENEPLSFYVRWTQNRLGEEGLVEVEPWPASMGACLALNQVAEAVLAYENGEFGHALYRLKALDDDHAVELVQSLKKVAVQVSAFRTLMRAGVLLVFCFLMALFALGFWWTLIPGVVLFGCSLWMDRWMLKGLGEVLGQYPDVLHRITLVELRRNVKSAVPVVC